MAHSNVEVANRAYEKIASETKKLEIFLSVQSALAADQLCCTKQLYDLSRLIAPRNNSSTVALQQLLVGAEFDAEQVWQQLEAGCNAQDVARLEGRVDAMAASFQSISFDELVDAATEAKIRTKSSVVAETVMSESEGDADDESEDEKEEQETRHDIDVHNSEDTNSLNAKENVNSERIEAKKLKSTKAKEKAAKAKHKPSTKRESIVDDDFFKLSEMETFADMQEKKERKKLNDAATDKSDDEDDDDDDDVSLDDSANEEEMKAFGQDQLAAGEDDRENDSEASEEEEEAEEEDGDSDDSENERDFWKTTKTQKDAKSSFEKRREKMQERLTALEEQNLAEKPWQLKGEVMASDRPENSLLSEVVEFEHHARQPPMITEELTKTEESFIIQRIKDKAWDDVERKVKPRDTGFDYRKRVVLDGEKSKLGLADQYAAEYEREAARLAGQEVKEKENPKHAEIRKGLEKLFIKLDALSNFHFTPKPVVRDIEIITNEPSIAVEEVAPSHLSDAALLAPEQIQRQTRGQLVGATERTTTDRRRERRRKKKLQHDRRVTQEQKDKSKAAAGVVETKETAMKRLEKKSRSEKGITLIKEKGGRNKKTASSSFFSQLQDEVTATVKRKNAKPALENQPSSKKIKL